MASQKPMDPFFRGGTSRNTRSLLRLVILCTIAAAAVASRLFSVIRTLPFHRALRLTVATLELC